MGWSYKWNHEENKIGYWINGGLKFNKIGFRCHLHRLWSGKSKGSEYYFSGSRKNQIKIAHEKTVNLVVSSEKKNGTCMQCLNMPNLVRGRDSGCQGFNFWTLGAISRRQWGMMIKACMNYI